MAERSHRPDLDEHALRAIEALCDVPLRDDAWQEFLEILRTRLDAHSVFLAFRLSDDTWDSLQVQASRTAIGNFTERYFKRFAAENPFHYASMIPNRLYRLENFIPGGNRSDSVVYREHLMPEGLATVEVVKLGLAEGPWAYLAWIREEQSGALSGAEQAWLTNLLPHANRAVAIFSRLRQSQRVPELLAEMFDRLSFGLFVIGHDMRVIFSNELARSLIGRSDALAIRHDVLTLRDSAQAKMVATLAAQPGRAEAMPIVERVLRIGREGQTIGALLVPIGPRDVFDTAVPARLMIYLHDLGTRPRASAALVGKLFGLAPAEAKLAILLGEGLTLREAATRMGITENSVRSYCKSIFQKTGVGRQADLVQQIHQSIAIFAEDAAIEQ